MTIQALLSERLKAAVATSRLYPGDTVLILEAIPVLEAAEAWAKADEKLTVAAAQGDVSPARIAALDDKQAECIQRLRAALAAHGPSQEKERT